MVDVTGHLGMALIWLAPAWYFTDRPKVVATFVTATVWFGMLPDVDLVLSNHLPTVHHHGLFHTVVVVTLLAAVLGPVLGWMLGRIADRSTWSPSASTRRESVIGFLGVWVPGLSHLFADMLSAPDASQAIEPLWPVYGARIVTVDVFWYTSVWATWALFVVGIGVHVALWYRRAGRGRSWGDTAPS